MTLVARPIGCPFASWPRNPKPSSDAAPSSPLPLNRYDKGLSK